MLLALVVKILGVLPNIGLPFLKEVLSYYNKKQDLESQERSRYLESSIRELEARKELQLKELDHWLFRLLKNSIIAITAVYLWAILIDSVGQQLFWWNWDVLAHPLLDHTTMLVLAYLFLVSGYKVLTK
jgi:hypothetical protein